MPKGNDTATRGDSGVPEGGTSDENPFEGGGGGVRRAIAKVNNEAAVAATWRYALDEIRGVRHSWARKTVAGVDRFNAARDPATQLPTMWVPGDKLLGAGAALDELRELHALTYDEIVGLQVEAAAIRAGLQRQINAEGARRAALDGVRRAPLASTLLSVSQLAELPPPRPLDSGLIAAGASVQLVGPPGSGKSFAAVGLSCCVATGRDLSGQHRVPEARPVVYAAAEGASGMYQRIVAWCHHHGLTPADLDGKLHVFPHAVQIGEELDMDELTALVASLDAGLVVIDTRARSTAGLEENSATEQNVAIGHLDRLIEKTGAAVLTVHHSARGTNRARGSSVWDGAVTSTLAQSADGEHTTITCAKHKDEPDGCEHLFKLEDSEGSLVFVPADPMVVALEDAPESASKLVEMVKDLGGKQGLTRPEIVKFGSEEINGKPRIAGRTRMYTLVREAADAGTLVNVGPKRTARFIAAELMPETSE